ncbi:transposase [Staphylococcus chromogenes]|uniref:transposase n=1 Tax=Staphylococcus chromogenes TaxID=46126 RepID=UPI003D7B6AE3
MNYLHLYCKYGSNPSFDQRPIEGINNKIKLITHVAYGYRNLITLEIGFSSFRGFM